MTVLERLRKLTNAVDDALLEELLLEAKEAILAARYPFGNWPDEIEPQYVGLQVRIAEAIYNKIGGKFQTSHSENGVSRAWGSEDIPQELLAKVVPKCELTR